MSASDDDAQLALLTRLFTARGPGALASFRDECVDDPAVSVADLAVAQQLLRDVADALTKGGAARWQGLERALDTTLPAAPPSAAHTDVDTTVPAQTQPSATERAPARLDDDVDATQVMPIDPGEGSTLRMRTGTKESGVPSELGELDRYAVLCAWSQIYPERRAQLHRQFGLRDEDDRVALDARMAAVFASDPQLRAAFAQRLRLHLGHLEVR